MKKILLLCLCISINVNAQDKLNFHSEINFNAFLSKNNLPFWSYANSNGFRNEYSDLSLKILAQAKYAIFKSDTIQLGLGGFLRDGFNSNIQRSDAYIAYKHRWFKLIMGSKSKPEKMKNLSTINDNILNTGNVRPIPGVILSSNKPLNISNKLTVFGALAHYNLNDDRVIENTNIHFKRIGFGYKFNDINSMMIGLRHYAQWGGITVDGVSLPADFTAFKEVFMGKSGTGTENTNETINALGNHLGSYELKYNFNGSKHSLELYHQTLFEDRSGRELNNFPDGVWGAFINTKNNNLFKSFLIEYIQTVSQSGSPSLTSNRGQQSGADNYFSNSLYLSGWTYEGRVIGLPFIIPSKTSDVPNNRIYAIHLGIAGNYKDIDANVKLTYLENLGTYRIPFPKREKKILSYLEIKYPTENFGIFNGYLGADFSNINENVAAIGVGYSYRIN